MSEKKTIPDIYTSESKESAVKLAIESDQPIAQTAKDLGINPNTLHTWISKYSKPKRAEERTDEHLYDELRRLKKELARVTQERDLLKNRLHRTSLAQMRETRAIVKSGVWRVKRPLDLELRFV